MRVVAQKQKLTVDVCTTKKEEAKLNGGLRERSIMFHRTGTIVTGQETRFKRVTTPYVEVYHERQVKEYAKRVDET